jgi:hypothetical protein
MFAAVGRLEPRDVPLRTRYTGEDSTGWKTYDPAYRVSESGESLHYNGDGVFYDHKHGEGFGVLAPFTAEEGIISNPWDRLDGDDWWDTVEVPVSGRCVNIIARVSASKSDTSSECAAPICLFEFKHSIARVFAFAHRGEHHLVV